MEKIIICGNEIQSQEIKRRLAFEDFEIVTLDLSKEPLPDIFSKSDAVFIAADNSQEEILKSTSMVNCDIEIINYSCFRKSSLENPVESMTKELPYTGLIIGMSHAQCAIKPEKLRDQVYCNCAAPSMDMFCHLKYLSYLSELYPNKLKNMKRIILEFPYYIFNYDLSKFGAFVYTKLNYFELIDDYHHFGECAIDKNKITEFKRFKKYFRPENISPISAVKNNLIRKSAKLVLKKWRIATKKDKVWQAIYHSTIDENQKLWQELLVLLEKVSPNAKITVLIMPFNPVFRVFHRREIKVMKKIFMLSLGTGKFEIIDHFDCLHRDDYFDDHCHLNKKGASKYIKILQEALVSK